MTSTKTITFSKHPPVARNSVLSINRRSSILTNSLKNTLSSPRIPLGNSTSPNTQSNPLKAALSGGLPRTQKPTSTQARLFHKHKRHQSSNLFFDSGVAGVNTSRRQIVLPVIDKVSENQESDKLTAFRQRHKKTMSEIVTLTHQDLVKDFGAQAYRFIAKGLKDEKSEKNGYSRFALFDKRKSEAFKTFSKAISGKNSRLSTPTKVTTRRETVSRCFRISIRGSKLISED